MTRQFSDGMCQITFVTSVLDVGLDPQAITADHLKERHLQKKLKLKFITGSQKVFKKVLLNNQSGI
jgi:hypothetical protein